MQKRKTVAGTRSSGGWVFFTNSQRKEGKGEVLRGKLQTNTVRFVCFFPTPWKTTVRHPFWPDNNICKQLLTKEREREKKGGEKNMVQLQPQPIKRELNKNLSSNHSRMNTHVAIVPTKDIFCFVCTDIIFNHFCMCLIKWLLSFLCVLCRKLSECLCCIWVCRSVCRLLQQWITLGAFIHPLFTLSILLVRVTL